MKMGEGKDVVVDRKWERATRFNTWSGLPVKESYGPDDIEDFDYCRDLNEPGEYPYTRGIHRDMYRGKIWTRRVFVGLGTPKETNERYKYLIERGMTGMFCAIDQPTQYGIDSDHPLAKGNVGVVGVPLCSLQDAFEIYDGISLESVAATVQGITYSASVVGAAYFAAAESRGFDLGKLRGSVMNDPLHANFCGWEISSPLRLSLKLSVDFIEYCRKNVPLWHPSVPCGYDVRERGITAIQELAFNFGNAIAYIDAAIERGVTFDDYATRVLFSLSSEMDFFEEICKFRAARRIWARIAKERYGAKDPNSCKLFITVHTAGSSLTGQQPINNVIRTTIESLASVLGGVQSLDPCGYDEAFCIPSEEAATVALNVQHIIAYESGAVNTVDPLAGSYYVESLTNKIEEEATRLLEEIEEMGGMVSAIEKGWIRKEMEKAAVDRQNEVEDKRRIIVGVNEFDIPRHLEIPLKIHRRDRDTEMSSEREQVEKIRKIKNERNIKETRKALIELEKNAEGSERTNLMPNIMESLKSSATLGEILGVIREASGLSYDPFNMIGRPEFLK
jgi:methylmalonyl-CoA mutase N-terminal domain/subunit